MKQCFKSDDDMWSLVTENEGVTPLFHKALCIACVLGLVIGLKQAELEWNLFQLKVIKNC